MSMDARGFDDGEASGPHSGVSPSSTGLIGETIDEAAERAYAAVEKIDFDGKQLRHDIGWRARTR